MSECPPVLIGEKVWWLGSGSGLPKKGVVKWIGKLAEIGPDWAIGIELEECLPYGGVDGTWRGRQLFKCRPKHGLIVPSDRVLAKPSPVKRRVKRTSREPRIDSKEVVAPPRQRRALRESLLLDKHPDFKSVHREALLIRNKKEYFETETLEESGRLSSENSPPILSEDFLRRNKHDLATRKGKTNSGIFAFFKWFRREREEEERALSNPSSPVLKRVNSNFSGSVDTLFSTATATSFSFIPPSSYRPFESHSVRRICPGPETNSYRNRIKKSNELRVHNRNISLREKYNLYASGSIGNDLDLDNFEDINEKDSVFEDKLSTLKKKKPPPPPPPTQSNHIIGSDSLPSTLNKIQSPDEAKLHRRTVSESSKYKQKACHVKGKRKAPNPPLSEQGPAQQLSSTVDNDFSQTLRKKRKAPPPPLESVSQGEELIESSGINSESSLKETDILKDDVAPTDTLRLEKGILKPNKMEKALAEPKPVTPTSPLSPRPWYKRTHLNQSTKQNDRKKDIDKLFDEWMFESGIPRRPHSFLHDNKFNIFSRIDKPEDKRKSQISVLTNISELDREAAEIIRKEKESRNEQYYTKSEETANGPPLPLFMENNEKTEDNSKKASTRELISLFNAITNVTKVTVNSKFFSSNHSFFKKDSPDKQITVSDRNMERNKYSSQLDELKENSTDTDVPIPIAGPSRIPTVETKSVDMKDLISESPLTVSKVTIEELDEYDSKKGEKKAEISKTDKSSLYPRLPSLSEMHEVLDSSDLKDDKVGQRSDSGSSLNSSTSGSSPEKSSIQNRFAMWTCSRCTLENARWRLTCAACDSWRPTLCDYKQIKKEGASPKQPTVPATDPIHHEPTSVEPPLVIEPKVRAKIFPTKVIPQFAETNASLVKECSAEETQPNSKPEIAPRTKKDAVTSITKFIKANQPSDGQSTSVADTETNDKSNTLLENMDNNDISNKEMDKNNIVRKARLAFLEKEKKITPDTKSEVNGKLDENIKSEKEKIKETSKKEKMFTSNSVEVVANQKSVSEKNVSDDLEKHEILNEMKMNLKKKGVKNLQLADEFNANLDTAKSADVTSPDGLNINKNLLSADTKKKGDVALSEVSKIDCYQQQATTSEGQENKKAEAYLVKREIIVEKTQVKKKPEKVSSSVQTTGKVSSTVTDRRESNAPSTSGADTTPQSSCKPDQKEIVVPVVVEEYVLNAKNGPSSSFKVEPMKFEPKKFELMRPRDFADVKAMKLEKIHTESSPSTSAIPGSSKQALEMEISNNDLDNLNTMSLNRILRRLETAIENGQHDLAADLAKELARLKISCSVVRQRPETSYIIVDMYVEDKASHRGPISLRLKSWTRVGDLKMKVFREFHFPIAAQRWIINKRLATDDRLTLAQLGVSKNRNPVFLYLVQPDKPSEETAKRNVIEETAGMGDVVNSENLIKENAENNLNREASLVSEVASNLNVVENNLSQSDNSTTGDTLTLGDSESEDEFIGWKCPSCTLVNSDAKRGCEVCATERPDASHVQNDLSKPSTSTAEEDRLEHYKRLVDLEKDEVVASSVQFDCPVCLISCSPSQGVVLRECLHTFCRACLADTVRYSDEAEVKCPYRDATYTCDSVLLEREIKALVTPEVYEEHLAKSVAAAEAKIQNAFHCKTPDCRGWCIYEDNVNLFLCPVCNRSNCLTCQAIHEGLNCKQYQEQVNRDSEVSVDAKRTRDMLQEMVDRGEALMCPSCQVVLMKKWGCDWLRCTMCMTEICWVTKGPRWGPNGKGDTSGGCRCRVNGSKCHPKCSYCH